METAAEGTGNAQVKRMELEPAAEHTGHEDRLGMTEEQWQQLKEWTVGYGEQDENGVDLSLLRANLKLTPTERIEKMRRALALVLEVRRAGAAVGLSSNVFLHA